MKLSICIAVLQSYEVVVSQLKHFSKFLSTEEFLGNCELVIVDDGSEPSIFQYILNNHPEFYTYLFNNFTPPIGWTSFTTSKPFNFTLFNTYDTRFWTQPIARNSGSKVCSGEYILFTDIDHILTIDSIRNSIIFTGDKLDFRRTWGILDPDGNVVTDSTTLIDYGLKQDDIGRIGSHPNTFCIKKSIFETLGGYGSQFHTKYGGDDTDFLNRYGKLHYSGQVQRSSISHAIIYVYPNPRLDKKHIFHDIRRKS